MRERLENTIVAIATPIGEGAISIIRVSGDSAIKKVSCRFRGTKELLSAKSHSVHVGCIVDAAGKTIDEVVCTVFRAPHSYTGEDIVEVNCHGGIHVTKRVLECLIETGAVPAEPGEFTLRSFLNGKLDLSQAEAIADLIKAQSDKAQQISLMQLEGVLSKQVLTVREQLVNTVSLLELELDFAEENIELINKRAIEESINQGLFEIEQLLGTYKYGKVWREGVRVALVGIPNVGKSSLLNAMLNEERAIVTNIPGTTRDFIEEKLTINGILFRLIDTAGLCETNNPIELEGVRRTWNVVRDSDIVVLVHDSTQQFIKDELEVINTIKEIGQNRQSIIIVNNKIDLFDEKARFFPKLEDYVSTKTSAVNNTGIEEFKNVLLKQVIEGSTNENRESITITNERHYSALLKAKEQLKSAFESLRRGESEEFIAADLRNAINSIGEIVGLITTEEILNNIFSKFCIGK